MVLQVVEPKDKQKPFLTGGSHARLRHDHALWHPEHADQVMRKTSKKIPFSEKSKFDSYKIALEAIDKSAQHSAVVATNRLLTTTFDLGYQTGFDAKKNRVVSSVTVVTKVTGEVVTVYPGTP